MVKQKKSIDTFGDALKALAEYIDKNKTSRHEVLKNNQDISSNHRMHLDVEFLSTFSKNNTILTSNKK